MIKTSLEKYQVENTICNVATFAVVDGAPEYIQEHNIRGDANIQYICQTALNPQVLTSHVILEAASRRLSPSDAIFAVALRKDSILMFVQLKCPV